MLADSSEAAIRSLQDHSEPVIRAMIKKVFDDIISDGQMDQSNLTMREISLIGEALVKAFKSLYHERVRYPGFNPEETGEHPVIETRTPVSKPVVGESQYIPLQTNCGPTCPSDRWTANPEP